MYGADTARLLPIKWTSDILPPGIADEIAIQPDSVDQAPAIIEQYMG